MKILWLFLIIIGVMQSTFGQLNPILNAAPDSVLSIGIKISNSSFTCPSSVLDEDGNVYSTVLIGSQCWMKENLKVSKYRNGDTIPTNLRKRAWKKTRSGAYTFYNEEASNDSIFGKLYNWYAVADPRGLCPTGWHVPSDDEWKALEIFLGMPAGGINETWGRGESQNVGGKMKALSSLWKSPNTGANNFSGFTAIPGGYRIGNGPFRSFRTAGVWWSSTEVSSFFAWFRELNYRKGFSFRNSYTKNSGYYIRCLRD